MKGNTKSLLTVKIICPRLKSKKDTSLNVGSNNVAGHVKVDADEFSL